MKQLLLFRHAKSGWIDAALPDIQRPLSARGERDAPRMADRLRARRTRPGLLLASPAARTVRTANILASALDCDRELIHVEQSLYLATPDTILDVVATQDPGMDCLLVVGHNPGLTDLANCLLPDLALDNLPTSGVVAINCGGASWTDLRTTACTLAYYDYPKNSAPFVTGN